MSMGGSPVDGGISVQLYETVLMLISYHMLNLLSETVAGRHLCNCTATDVDNVCTIVRFGSFIMTHLFFLKYL